MTAEIAVQNYIRKPIKRKKTSKVPGTVDLEDEPIVLVAPPKPLKPLGKDYSNDHLGNNDRLYERNKQKNFDGKKIRGLNVNGFADIITQPNEDSEYNKHGRQRHELVPFTEA